MSSLSGISFSAPLFYAKGVQPSVAINNNGFLVEVHKLDDSQDLSYQFVEISDANPVTSLGEPRPLTNPGKKDADTGWQPNCAMNNSQMIVEVHQANNEYGPIWTHVGVGNSTDKTVTWYKSENTGYEGISPSVAVTDDNKVILVFEGKENLDYVIGEIVHKDNEYSIKWVLTGTIQQWKGTNPVVSINKKNQVALAYLYNTDDGKNSNVCCSVSIFDPVTNLIKFPNDNQLNIRQTAGKEPFRSPGVAISDDGTVLIAMEDGKTKSFNVDQPSYSSILQIYTGKVTSTGIGTDLDLTIDAGQYPGVGRKPIIASSQDGKKMIMVAEAPDGSDTQSVNFCLGFQTASSVPLTGDYNPAVWMSAFSSQSLGEICFPGAHDAGMYTVQDCTIDVGSSQAQTQQYNFNEMLKKGIRYFDVRPVLYQNKLYTGHFSGIGAGCCGGTMQDVLSDVGLFIEERGDSAQEVIVLKFSHYHNRDTGNADPALLIEATKDALNAYVKEYLFINLTSHRLADLSLDQIAPVSSNESGPSCRIIAVFDEMTAATHDPKAGFYSYQDLQTGQPADLVVFDDYSDTNKTKDMVSGQIGLLENITNHAGDLFLLSWTLTPDWTDEVAGTTSVRQLANQANPILMSNMLQLVGQNDLKVGVLPNVLYVDFADTFVTDVAVSLNTYLQMMAQSKMSNVHREKAYV